MLADDLLMRATDMLLAMFTAYIFFFYFNTFFEKKKKSICVLTGLIVFVFWQISIPKIIRMLPVARNIGVTVGVTLFAVINIFDGTIWKKSFFVIIFDAIWMLVETLVNNLLMLYYEHLAFSQRFGAFVSRILFFAVIVALKKIFTNEEIKELPSGHNILLVFIPIGSIYIMNAVFTLAYNTSWEYAELYSLISVVILLFINGLVFYVYIKLAEELLAKRMNVVYEQQLELCERHQAETELSMQQMRAVRHSMRNHFILILTYAKMGECGQIIQFVNDLIKDGKLELSETVNTGNIVTDSLVGYWKRIAEQKGIKFLCELSIPVEMPFKGADISLILGNLLENAVEGAEKAEKKKYIRLKIKYDKKNLLIMVENSYKGKMVKGKGEELKTTKTDTTNHGIGLSSVRRAAEKYHGTIFIDDSIPECFLIRIVLYGE